MFDSPFEFCRQCGEYVLLDQTQAQCAREHRCRDREHCALRRYFTGVEFTEGKPAGSHPAAKPVGRKRTKPT